MGWSLKFSASRNFVVIIIVHHSFHCLGKSEISFYVFHVASRFFVQGLLCLWTRVAYDRSKPTHVAMRPLQSVDGRRWWVIDNDNDKSTLFHMNIRTYDIVMMLRHKTVINKNSLTQTANNMV